MVGRCCWKESEELWLAVSAETKEYEQNSSEEEQSRRYDGSEDAMRMNSVRMLF